MRDTINNAVKTAMKAKESERLSTLRLINAAIKDRDIALRGEGNLDGVTDQDILGILGKMIKQRKDSATAFHDAGRTELEAQELSEIKVIEEFLPKQLSEDETRDAVKSVIDDLGADSIRDMGKVMGVLKENYAGQMDFGKAGGVVKALLA
ncbi:aspartyl-tRNA amidotransferase subunit B [Amylibacter ulvae]|uniref:Aspartyl-tRNA amidotransferase subunit B n=1 Tax=Paramylibacter ulvae TaxID=1651968 RepID=A0ABQ3D4F5_9RHOB|nr:GatB/YqeY domain-containing protein [Amylibacter ulvae]GHA55258.1 aspartyl-tRNA amidotransferase subunit B [Amylibacter ulvae]